jgi:hypothetical protein
MAPIVYLLVFLRACALVAEAYGASLKVIGALNLLVFFFLYFTESGSLHLG